MKRNPRKLAWTKSFRRAHGKELIVDGTLLGEMNMKRNVATRYSRENVANVLAAMERYSEIRNKRERRMYLERMKGNKARQLEADRKLVRENQHLLPPHERDVAQEMLAEDDEMASELEDEETMLDVDESEIAMDREAEALAAVKAEEKKKKGKQPAAKQDKRRKAIIGQRPDGMDIDG